MIWGICMLITDIDNNEIILRIYNADSLLRWLYLHYSDSIIGIDFNISENNGNHIIFYRQHELPTDNTFIYDTIYHNMLDD